jgi:hypothetical protein
MGAYVEGKLVGVDATGMELGSMEFALCGYGAQTPRGPFTFARLNAKVLADNQGVCSITLQGNDVISPEGTYYTVTTRNSNGDIAQVNAYIFNDGGSYDLDMMDPFDPSFPMPPLPPPIVNQLQSASGGPTFTFDGSQFLSFQYTLDQDATCEIENAKIGNLYTFIIRQDAAGNHVWTWPFYIFNATPINSEPNSVTIQTFILTDEPVNGHHIFYPISGPTWWTP